MEKQNEANSKRPYWLHIKKLDFTFGKHKAFEVTRDSNDLRNVLGKLYSTRSYIQTNCKHLIENYLNTHRKRQAEGGRKEGREGESGGGGEEGRDRATDGRGVFPTFLYFCCQVGSDRSCIL